jgi:hypothetical protein
VPPPCWNRPLCLEATHVTWSTEVTSPRLKPPLVAAAPVAADFWQQILPACFCVCRLSTRMPINLPTCLPANLPVCQGAQPCLPPARPPSALAPCSDQHSMVCTASGPPAPLLLTLQRGMR